MLDVTQLTCQRGDRILFKDLEFTLEAHQWLQIAGPNGAGKSSLLRLLAGLGTPLSGKITWQGQSIADDREPWHRSLLYIGHQGALKEELTPLENLTYGLGLEGWATDDNTVTSSLQEFGLSGREQLPVRYLSAGQRRRVLLCRLRLRPAQLWILDEPFTALDSAASLHLSQLIEAHLDRGGCAILTSHQSIELREGFCIQL